MKLLRPAGATSQILQIFIQDSSSTTGAGLTGLTNASSSLTAYYHRDTDTTATAISLVTMTVGTFTSSGFKEIDATNMPGWYQLCPPNAALAAGAASCGIHLKGATNMAPLPIEIDLDPQVDVKWWNGTAVATPATAGIPDINVKNINNVSTSSVTTVNANQGTTQPLNFTGTAGSALVKVDAIDINSVAASSVTTISANIGTTQPVNFTGTSSSALVKVDAIDINSIAASSVTTINANLGTTQPVNFTGTAGSALVKCDMVDIAGAAVSTTTAQLGVNAVQINAVSTSSVTTVNANVGTTQPTNFTGTGASALVKSDMVDVAGAAVSTTTAQIGVNAVKINNVATTSVTDINANIGTTQPVNFTGTGSSALVKTDVIDWKSTAIPTPVTSGYPDVVLADGVAHGGTPGSSTATLGLQSLKVQAVDNTGVWMGASGYGMLIRSYTAQPAISIEGNGTGVGVDIYGANDIQAIAINSYGTGDAITINTENGNGLNIAASGSGKHGVLSAGGTDGDGFHGTGAGTGVGFHSIPDAAGFGSGSTPADIASAVWQDLLVGGDFSVSASIGKLLGSLAVDANGRIEIQSGYTKNTAFDNFAFPMVQLDGVTAASGLTVTCQRLIDSGTFGPCTNASATEVGSTAVYKTNLTASDLNGDLIVFRATAPGAAARIIIIRTTP